LHGVQGVASSNPATPTRNAESPVPQGAGLFCFWSFIQPHPAAQKPFCSTT
jgi:hypothetical protein